LNGIRNILFISPVPLFPLGASNYIIYRIIKELFHIDYNITLVCPEISKNHRSELEDFQKSHSINVLDQLKLGNRKGFLKHVRYIFHNRNTLKSYIEGNEISLIHCVNPPDIIPLIASELAFTKKIPFIFHIADPGPESMETIFNGFKKKLFFLLSSVIEKRVLNRSSGLITVNNFLKNQIIKTRYISEHNFKVVYNIPTTDEVNLREITRINNSLIYIGTLHTVTGLQGFIENYKSLYNWEKTTVFVVGDGPQKKDLVKICSSFGLENNIIFKGHIVHQEAMQLLKSSTLAIIPYLNNPLTKVSLPTKLFEYIKLSKTVICPNLPGFTELLGSDNPGLYDINDKLGIYKTIQKFFNDKILVEQTEKMNFSISKNYSLKKEVEKIDQLYRSIIR